MPLLSFDIDGNYIPHSPELLGAKSEIYDNFIVGNIHKDKIEDVSENKNFKKITKEVNEGIDACYENCDYFHTCGGGHPADRYFEHGNLKYRKLIHAGLGSNFL